MQDIMHRSCSSTAPGGSSTRRRTGDLVRVFYVPALEDAARYDRLTGYFDAGALALAARGVEGLVRNDGRMRLIVGCTLDREEIDAIREGETLRERVERHLTRLPLAPPDTDAAHALELLAWMVGRGCLDVKVAIPLRHEPAACRGHGDLPREVRRHRGSRRLPDRLDRQPQRDNRRLAAQLGEHQRLPKLGSGTGAGGP